MTNQTLFCALSMLNWRDNWDKKERERKGGALSGHRKSSNLALASKAAGGGKEPIFTIKPTSLMPYRAMKASKESPNKLKNTAERTNDMLQLGNGASQGRK